MEVFATTVNGFQPVTIVANLSALGVCKDPSYTAGVRFILALQYCSGTVWVKRMFKFNNKRSSVFIVQMKAT